MVATTSLPVTLTGDPKGAMMTHENVIADAAAYIRTIEVSKSAKDVSA